MRVPRFAVAVITALVAAPPRAHADDAPNAPLSYGVAVGELATFGVFAANFNNLWPSTGPALILNFTPMVLGPAAALGAHYGQLDVRPALATHGAGWFGVTGLMLGALIDGRATRWQMKRGVFAWSLGAVGAIAGGVLGATSVDTVGGGAVWLAAPPLGFVAGGLVIGGFLVLLGGLDGDDAIGQFSTGAIAGSALGLGVATWFAFHDSDGGTTSRVQASVDGPALSDDRATIFSFGGAW